MTNLEWLRSLSPAELAPLLLQSETTFSFRNMAGHSIHAEDVYLTPDKKGYYEKPKALSRIQEWLGEERHEANMEANMEGSVAAT